VVEAVRILASCAKSNDKSTAKLQKLLADQGLGLDLLLKTTAEMLGAVNKRMQKGSANGGARGVGRGGKGHTSHPTIQMSLADVQKVGANTDSESDEEESAVFESEMFTASGCDGAQHATAEDCEAYVNLLTEAYFDTILIDPFLVGKPELCTVLRQACTTVLLWLQRSPADDAEAEAAAEDERLAHEEVLHTTHYTHTAHTMKRYCTLHTIHYIHCTHHEEVLHTTHYTLYTLHTP
jgi:hypothetical protein